MNLARGTLVLVDLQPALSPDRGGAGHGHSCPRGALSSLGPWIQRTHQAIDKQRVRRRYGEVSPEELEPEP
jgi:mRNA-degrading endonuclease toxin of MazEF toxin-antitoxin module